ncbi:biotin--[acetyl-CoA-carboxylase] ligase [Helicobacter cetorum]|uniref:biotin--[acetyl-CoA-carboxylase] ligase n=1 Tax=Helicobacter cetorum TaxID=138563 RepID=UPI000CF067A3|nr:biotin--[acetyl-CoA-carboxylase] ligase [Helicobacter cetorum]
MKIMVFESLPSTQTYLLEQLKSKQYQAPIAVLACKQSAGIGSRGNTWESVEKALTFSFALNDSNLPKDLPMQASALYLGFLFKEVLKELGSSVWLKWPNDLYIEEQKIGGVLVQVFRGIRVCGIGINRVATSRAVLDINENDTTILECFFKKVKEKISWGQVLSKYALEFHKNYSFNFHTQSGTIMSLKDALLLEDGRIAIKGKTHVRI